MNDTLKNQLKSVSTATIATCLYKLGLKNQFIQEVKPLGANRTNMVGPAFTLRYIPAREDRNPISVFENRDHPQRKAVEECPPGAVMVIDCRNDPRAASAGSILVTRMQVRGCAGIVTDGGFRDSPEISELEIPAYHQHPSSPTNLTHHEAIEIDGPIACGDVAVFPGDIVVGDAEGVVVIPHEMVAEIAEEAEKMTEFENFVIERVKQGHSILGLYPATDPKYQADFEAWKSKRGS